MKDWLKKLNDPTRDVYERRYRLISAIAIAMLFLWLLVASTVDYHSVRILFFATCNLLFIPTMIFTLRTGRIQLGAGASGIVLVFLMIPMGFFYNGGIQAGAPNWCLIALVFVTLTIRGRLCTFLQIADIVVTIACYVLTYTRPELIQPYTSASAYVDSLASLIITGALIGSMFLFQLHMSRQEHDLLTAQQKEIMDLNQAQSRFFSSMSHEIRTPINTIIGLNEMILREDISDEVAEDANNVRAASKLLLHLINDILDMSRFESGRMTLTPTAYDVGDMLSEIVGMFWMQASEKGLEFRVDIDPDLPARLYGDEVRIRQIVINILNNAFKYTHEGSVTLSVQRRETENGLSIVFSVTDTGMGIKKENLPNLFSAFRRVDEQKNRTIEGTGLGLTIVKQLTDLMGGAISVNSVYTRGSTFIIELPQGRVGDARLGELRLQKRTATDRRSQYMRRFEAPNAHILVVDDNTANLMVVKKLLRDTKMTIDTAESGAEALQKTLTTAYPLIFMDHLMPEMDGIECLRHIREQTGGLCRLSRVVALTANADRESQALYAKEGFDGYLVKPTSGEALERECQRLLPPELVRLSREDDQIVQESVSWLTRRERKADLVVTTDSVADLPPALLRQYSIVTIPHRVLTPEGRFLDDMEIESNGLIDYMEHRDAPVQTLAPEVADYEAFFAEQLQRGNHVLHISITSQTQGSGCITAMEAASAFENVTVFDSGHLSSGEGLLALEAARMAAEGLSPDIIVCRLEALREQTHTSFIVDSLSYLARSRRIGPRAFKAAQAFMLHPVLALKDGRIRVRSVHYGERRRAWCKYIRTEFLFARNPDRRRLFVTYVGLDQKALDFIRQEIEKCQQFDEILFQKASPAIAVNCGPGTFGLLYIDRDSGK